MIMDELKGYTFTELMENAKRLAIQIKAGNFPEGTDPKDFRIYGDWAVYCPYIPLQVTPPVDVYVSSSTAKAGDKFIFVGLDDTKTLLTATGKRRINGDFDADVFISEHGHVLYFKDYYHLIPITLVT